MAPKKKFGDRKKAKIQCKYLIQSEERKRSVPLLEYVQGIDEDIMTVEPPPGQAGGAANAPARLVIRAQTILFRIVDMVLDILDSGSCFETLTANMIAVDTYFDTPKLLVNNLVEKSDISTKSNLSDLGDILERVVSAASDSYNTNTDINPEFKDLIKLLRNYQTGDSFFLIRFHVCNLPLSNRTFLYTIMYDFIIDILRFADPEAFIFVINHLIYPPDWFMKLPNNSYMQSYYINGWYDPLATLNPNATDPRLEPLRYHRNCPAHALEGSADANAMHGMLLTRAQLGLALYFVFPMLLTSMQTLLHYLGELSSLDIEDLFPGRVSVHKKD